MKKIIIIITFLLFLTTGCKQYNDLNELAIIKSIGIDKKDEYTLYAEIIEKIDKDNNPQTKIIETNGKTMDDLFTNIKTLVNKEIYLSHIDLIILSDSLKNEDYKKIINYFLNHKEFRNDFLCVMSSEIKNVLEKSQYDEIEKLIMTNKESKTIIKINFEEIIKNFLDNKKFIISKVIYDQDEIKFIGNYEYYNNKLERIEDEKAKNRT